MGNSLDQRLRYTDRRSCFSAFKDKVGSSVIRVFSWFLASSRFSLGDFLFLVVQTTEPPFSNVETMFFITDGPGDVEHLNSAWNAL